jgi:hypothetical protein
VEHENAHGTYRVWQANDPSAAAAGWSAFPTDYRPTIDVFAGGLGEAYEATSAGAWWESMEVEVIADHVRSTAVGDVIVAPDGKAHRVKPEGFEEVDPLQEREARAEPPLQRAERQLRDWKVANSPAFIPDPAAGRIGPGTYRPAEDAWAGATEVQKLAVLESELDWTGVSDKDKEALLAREVDFTKISRDELNGMYAEITSNLEEEMGQAPARRLFDKANYQRTMATLDQAGTFGDQLTRTRDTTRSLVRAVAMDEWPSIAAVTDFGLESQRHYEALYYPIRNREIMPAALDAAMGYGEKLTELARNAPGNPHKDIQFHTAWDDLLGRPRTWDRPENRGAKYEGRLERELGHAAEKSSSPAELLNGKGAPPQQQERGQKQQNGGHRQGQSRGIKV